MSRAMNVTLTASEHYAVGGILLTLIGMVGFFILLYLLWRFEKTKLQNQDSGEYAG